MRCISSSLLLLSILALAGGCCSYPCYAPAPCYSCGGCPTVMRAQPMPAPAPNCGCSQPAPTYSPSPGTSFAAPNNSYISPIPGSPAATSSTTPPNTFATPNYGPPGGPANSGVMPAPATRP